MALLNFFQYYLCMALLLIFFNMYTFISLASSRLLSNNSSMSERHEAWMALHGRVYRDSHEKAKRFEIFKENVKRIEAFNAGPDQVCKLGVNAFSDMTSEEFRATHNGYKTRKNTKLMFHSEHKYFRYANVSSVPSAMDWRKKGGVTPVKDPHLCGSCWAFSAVAAMEGINQIKTGNLESLSQQELMDCDIGGEDKGCSGGTINDAFTFIIKNNGLTTESNYPYIGSQKTCNTKKASTGAATITGHENVPKNDEEALLKAVAHQPVSVAIDASCYEFQLYASGIFSGNCGKNLDHAVTAVGYGMDSDGTKYWLLKNSWGISWGDGGYMRMKRDVDAEEGLCGIAIEASYPTAQIIQLIFSSMV